MGSAVAVPGTQDVASSLGTSRASVSVSNDGTLLYSAGGSRYRLGWFGRDGTQRGTVGAIEQYIGLRLSPDGHEVLVTIRDAASGDLWRVDLTSGARSRVTSEGRGWYAVWSPDGQQVAFTGVNRREMLQAMNTRGGGEVENLSTFDVQVYPSDWSLDGKHLAYTANSQGTSDDVWLLAMTGRASRRRSCSRRSPSATRNSRPMASGWRLRRTKLDATTCTCRASRTRPFDGWYQAAAAVSAVGLGRPGVVVSSP